MNRRLFKANILIFAAYLLTALFALRVDPIAGFGSLIWPPAGIAIAGYFVFGARVWAAIFAGSLLANLWMNVSVWASIAVAMGNTVGPMLGVYVLRKRGFKANFSAPRQIPEFFLAVTFSSLVVAIVGVTSVEAFAEIRVAEFAFTLAAWWFGNIMGDIVVGPLILSIMYAKFREPLVKVARIEASLLFSAMTLMSLVIFFDWIPAMSADPKPYLVFPFVAWAAARFQQIGATLAVFLAVTIALFATYHGFGPFAQSSLDTSLFQLPSFVFTMSLMGLLLAAYVSTLNRTQAYLKRLNRRLDYQIHVRNQELRAANRDLRRSKQMLEHAQHIAHLGCWEWAPNRNVVHWSKELYLILGVQPSAFKATYDAYLGLLPVHEKERVDRLIRGAIEKGEPGFEFEHSLFRPNGEMLIVHCRGTAHRGPEGKLLEIIGTAQDITREKRILEDLRKATIASETANKEKSNFLANMSHEIRTPLSIILGSSELLDDPDVQPNERTRLVRSIQRNGNLLLALITDILDLSKIEAGKVQIEIGEVSLADLFEQIHQMLNQRIRERGLTFDIKITSSVPDVILTDSIRLQQIFVNVIGNALRFTSRGKIEVLTHILRNQERVQMAFDIRDTGIGMTRDQLQRIFNPFVQAEDSIKRQFGGTGLGLILSRRLARSLGGDLVVLSSSPGHGTTFRLTIDPGPLSSRKWVSHIAVLDELRATGRSSTSVSRDSAKANYNDEKNLLGIRVLLVDDSVENRQLITRFLKGAGATIDSATNGQQALEKVVKYNYDVILMDIQMPVLNGEEATRKLRKMGYRIPIIALTAHAFASDRRRFLEMGFTDYVSKPFTKSQLLEHVLHAH